MAHEHYDRPREAHAPCHSCFALSKAALLPGACRDGKPRSTPTSEASPVSHSSQPRPHRFHPQGALNGTIRVPGDKSISHRSIMLGALAWAKRA
jgi:hypothetical protein